MRTTKPRPLEKDVQQAIVDALRLAGLTVYETSAHKQKGPSGVDKGVPDLLVYTRCIPRMFIGIEVKRDSKASWTKEQVEAYENGCYPILYDPLTALVAVRECMNRYGDSVNGDHKDQINSVIGAMEQA